jgi:hypothetical protein
MKIEMQWSNQSVSMIALELALLVAALTAIRWVAGTLDAFD